MTKRRRSPLDLEADRRNQEQTGRLGRELRTSRLRRRLTQRQASSRVGIARSTWSAAERGHGGGLTLETWQRMAIAVGRPIRFELSRDPLEETSDAGHLPMQELVLRLGRHAGYAGSFELPTKPTDPSRSADVCLRDDRRRRLVLVEAWNVFGDVGGAARATNRKMADLEALAATRDGGSYRVGVCWVVRATARNRALVARYPELFTARFPGSSEGWRRALVEGTEPPAEPGLVWADVGATRLFAWRRRV